MLAAVISSRLGPDRSIPAATALGAMCGCAMVALVDPAGGGPYPACPTRALLGIDCPACGTLRGLHELSRGHLAAALDHNLLLLVAVPIGAVLWLSWVATALGRPTRVPTMPRAVIVTMIGVAVVFAMARNLPIDSMRWLNSA
ncbi:MAG: DUF2752 domain-containing protein [Acidimicrobiales bacterium]